MSLEKKRNSGVKKQKQNLEDSTFRLEDFKPLAKRIQVSGGEQEKEEIIEVKEIPEELLDTLSEIEKDVLDIAKDILKLKRYDAEFDDIKTETQIQRFPIIEKLYATCISKLAYNKGYGKEEIFLAIRNLEEKNWIVTNERRTKLEILNNEKLMNILNFIKKHPGIHARDERIEKELNITRTPFLKHVMTLENFKLIRSKKIGKTLHYFLEEIPDDLDKFRVIFMNPLIPKIIEELFKDETISISMLASNLDVYAGTVQYHLKKLKELNIVRSLKKEEGTKFYLVNIELLKKYNEIFEEPNFSSLLRGL
ncbi:MAG: winged helix-turn-helix transcriptional regulator [Promethearchaeota archaeon]